MPVKLGPVSLAFRFDGPVGAAQDRGAVTEVVRELGDNYAVYHTQLVAALAALGGRPEPEAYETREAFTVAWIAAERIVEAEAALRMCRAFRVEGRRLSGALDLAVPLVDGADRLVDVTRPAGTARPVVEARDDARLP